MVPSPIEKVAPVPLPPPIAFQAIPMQSPNIEPSEDQGSSRRTEFESGETESATVGESTIRPTDDDGSSIMPDSSFNKSFSPSDASSYRSEMDASGLSALDADSTYDTASVASKRRRRREKGDTVSNINYGEGNDDSVFTVDENESSAASYDRSDVSGASAFGDRSAMIHGMQASMREDLSYEASALSNISDMSRMSAVPGEASSMFSTRSGRSMGNRSAMLVDGMDSSFVSQASGFGNSSIQPSEYEESAVSDVKSIGMGASMDERSYLESKLTFNYDLSSTKYDASDLSQGNSDYSDISDLRSIKSLGLKYMIDEDQSMMSTASDMSKISRKSARPKDDLKSMRSTRSARSTISQKPQAGAKSRAPSVFGNESNATGARSVGGDLSMGMMSSMAGSESFQGSDYSNSISPSAFGNESNMSDTSRGLNSSFQDDATFQGSLYSGSRSEFDQSISPSAIGNSEYEASNASAMSKTSSTSNKSKKSITSKSSKGRTRKDNFDEDKLKKLNEKIEQRRAPAKPIKRKNESSEDSSISVDYDGITVASQSAMSGMSGASDISGMSGMSVTTYDSAVKDVLQNELDKMELSEMSQLSENVPQLSGKYTKKLKALNKMNEKEDKKNLEENKIRQDKASKKEAAKKAPK